MIKKEVEKENAIRLRKQGKTYREILGIIPVAKSTLSLWLRDVGIAKRQKQTLSLKKLAAGKRGGQARHSQRVVRYKKLFDGAKTQIGAITKQELFLIGTVLYWAEGAKEKADRPGSGFKFGNMDPKMILVIMTWLEKVCKIPKSMLVFELYIHKSHEDKVASVKKYWENILDIPKGSISRVYFKRNKLKKTNRKNIGDTYFGLIQLRVPESSDLVRKLAGWSVGISEAIHK